MTTLDDRLREAAAALRRVEPSVPTFARVRQRVRRRRALTAAAMSVLAAAIVAPVVAITSGHDRVVITNPDTTTVAVPTVPTATDPTTTPRVTNPVKIAPTSTPTAKRTTATTAPVAATASVSPTRIAVVAPGDAWLVGDDPISVYRTTDGGQRWTDVTPSAAHTAGGGIVDGFYARDDRNAVVAISTDSSSGSAALLRTADGGTTWTTATIGAYEAQHFSFVSDQRGFLEASLGAAAGSEPVDILRTLDGGSHWEVMSRSGSLDAQNPGTAGALDTGCDKTGIGFVDDNTGFASGICNGSGYSFSATHDAGRTWKPQALPTPPGIDPSSTNPYWEPELLPPVFAGANGAGIVISTVVTNNSTATHHDYVYFTRDRGAHWSLADPPLRDATWARVVDASNWWAGNATTLVHTSDAGAHWTTMPNTGLDLDISPELGDLQFPTPANGWALVGNRSTGALRAIATNDGGRTWRAVPLPHAR